MKGKNKRVLLFVMSLLICSVAISGCTTQKNLKESESVYQEKLKESQAVLSILEEETAELKRKNEELEKENKELQTKLTQVLSEKSDITTRDQAMSDLIDIYELYKSGKAKEAAEKIKKIEPMGFDDVTLAYYEILKDILEK